MGWGRSGPFKEGLKVSKTGRITMFSDNPWGKRDIRNADHIAANLQRLGLEPSWFFLPPLFPICVNIDIFLFWNFNSKILKLNLKFLNYKEVDDRVIMRVLLPLPLFCGSVSLRFARKSSWTLPVDKGWSFLCIITSRLTETLYQSGSYCVWKISDRLERFCYVVFP